MSDHAYVWGVFIVGIPTFLGCWGYAIAQYGFFLGAGLGWLPALAITAVTAGLWPLWLILAGVALLVGLAIA